MYEGIKKAFGPCANKIAPLKTTSGEIITNCSKQMERWAEHYQELYSRETIVTETAVENASPLPVMEELDDSPTTEELGKAMDSIASGKAPGNDDIPPEVIKAGKQTTLLEHLHELLLQCWEEGGVPQDMRDANVITLYKNKGDRSDCNNYRDTVRFRADRSTIDMIFSLRQLQEKYCKQRRLLYIAFIDLTKAFDLVRRAGLFTLLQRIGCPPSS